MKTEIEKLVCAVCGSENINEERLISMRVNSQTIIEDHLIDHYCQDCGDVVDIIEETEYKKINKN
jgi:very-short-patch-repair endonuclease